MSQTTPAIFLVILNWNGFADTHECLLSLRQVASPPYTILVVDNGSTDDSPQRIKEQHPQVELVVCDQNRGIAAGYNRGIAAALARDAAYIVVMNNDITFDAGFLSQMLSAQQSNPRCGIVMPKIYYFDEPDYIWSAGAYARWLPSNIVMRGRRTLDGPTFQKPVTLDFAPSCCLLLTRELCEQVAFDEQYFFYFDDWDFCKQARAQGFELVFAPAAHIWHKVSRSTQNSPKSLRWWKVLGQSCVRYHRKHHSGAVLALYIGWVLLRETLKGNVGKVPIFLAGIMAGLRARSVEDMRPSWRHEKT